MTFYLESIDDGNYVFDQISIQVVHGSSGLGVPQSMAEYITCLDGRGGGDLLPLNAKVIQEMED